MAYTFYKMQANHPFKVYFNLKHAELLIYFLCTIIDINIYIDVRGTMHIFFLITKIIK